MHHLLGLLWHLEATEPDIVFRDRIENYLPVPQRPTWRWRRRVPDPVIDVQEQFTQNTVLVILIIELSGWNDGSKFLLELEIISNAEEYENTRLQDVKSGHLKEPDNPNSSRTRLLLLLEVTAGWTPADQAHKKIMVSVTVM